jgi:IMP dehydrogenase
MAYLNSLKPSYCFDDVLLLPRYSNIASRKEIDLTTELSSNTELRSLRLKNPLISSPMDTVTGSKMAIAMALNGGLGIIHRFMSEEEQLREVEKVKRYVQYIFTEPYTINSNDNVKRLREIIRNTGVCTLCVINAKKQLVGILTNRDISLVLDNEDIYNEEVIIPKLMTATPIVLFYKSNMKTEDYLLSARVLMERHKVEKIPIVYKSDNKIYGIITKRCIEFYFNNKKRATMDNNGSLACGIAVGVANINWNHIDALINAGVDLLCVDVANGHNANCIKMVKELRQRYPNVIIMAGNIATGNGLEPLSVAGVDCVRIGIGNGSICSTRLQTGVGYGQFSAVNEIFEEKVNKGLSTKLICDGGSLGKIGNKMKALASGADAVMLGRSLASCVESPGMIINRNGKRVKYFRGMASKMASMSKTGDKAITGTAEGVDGVIDVRGSVADTIDEICGGLRSGMSYQGCRNMEDLILLRMTNEIKWGLSTAIGLSETGIRIKTF